MNRLDAELISADGGRCGTAHTVALCSRWRSAGPGGPGGPSGCSIRRAGDRYRAGVCRDSGLVGEHVQSGVGHRGLRKAVPNRSCRWCSGDLGRWGVAGICTHLPGLAWAGNLVGVAGRRMVLADVDAGRSTGQRGADHGRGPMTRPALASLLHVCEHPVNETPGSTYRHTIVLGRGRVHLISVDFWSGSRLLFRRRNCNGRHVS